MRVSGLTLGSQRKVAHKTHIRSAKLPPSCTRKTLVPASEFATVGRRPADKDSNNRENEMSRMSDLDLMVREGERTSTDFIRRGFDARTARAMACLARKCPCSTPDGVPFLRAKSAGITFIRNFALRITLTAAQSCRFAKKSRAPRGYHPRGALRCATSVPALHLVLLLAIAGRYDRAIPQAHVLFARGETREATGATRLIPHSIASSLLLHGLAPVSLLTLPLLYGRMRILLSTISAFQRKSSLKYPAPQPIQ